MSREKLNLTARAYAQGPAHSILDTLNTKASELRRLLDAYREKGCRIICPDTTPNINRGAKPTGNIIARIKATGESEYISGLPDAIKQLGYEVT